MFPRASRFQFVPGRYEGNVPAIGCDGLVAGAALDLTHWQGNRTPAEFKADTSTEIALKFVASEQAPKWSNALVVNNHFDTDGALSSWVLLEPDLASGYRSLLVAAAEAGDFDEWPTLDEGLWLDASVRALAAGTPDDAAAYGAVLPQLPTLLRELPERSDLWGAEWDQLRGAADALSRGRLHAERFEDIGLFRHAPGEPEVPGPLLARQFLPGAQRYLLAFEQIDGRFLYRYERPRYAWAVTVVRPPCPAPDASRIAGALGSAWTTEDMPGLTGIVQTLEPVAEPPAMLMARLRVLDSQR